MRNMFEETQEEGTIDKVLVRTCSGSYQEYCYKIPASFWRAEYLPSNMHYRYYNPTNSSDVQHRRMHQMDALFFFLRELHNTHKKCDFCNNRATRKHYHTRTGIHSDMCAECKVMY